MHIHTYGYIHMNTYIWIHTYGYIHCITLKYITLHTYIYKHMDIDTYNNHLGSQVKESEAVDPEAPGEEKEVTQEFPHMAIQTGHKDPQSVDLVSCSVASWKLPSGKQPHNYGKSPCLIGKSTISMVIFIIAMFVCLPEGSVFQLCLFDSLFSNG